MIINLSKSTHDNQPMTNQLITNKTHDIHPQQLNPRQINPWWYTQNFIHHGKLQRKLQANVTNICLFVTCPKASSAKRCTMFCPSSQIKCSSFNLLHNLSFAPVSWHQISGHKTVLFNEDGWHGMGWRGLLTSTTNTKQKKSQNSL